MVEEQFIEILRIRNFLKHNSKQITNIESEFTIKCNKEIQDKEKFVDNIFLTFNEFLPNLKVVDSEGMEYPIMSNTDTQSLLEIMKDESKDPIEIDNLIEDIKNHNLFLIWIKIPPCRKLQPNEVRILHLFFETRKINRFFGNHIYLDVSCDLSFPVFWIFEKPKDYYIKNQYCYTVEGDKLTNRRSWNCKDDVFYYDNTANASIFLVKPNQNNLLVVYSFSPKHSVVALPISSIVLLVSFSAFLIFIQNYAETVNSNTLSIGIKNLLERKIELSLFIVSSSLIIPRLISNLEIRHSYFWLYFVPIGLILIFFFGSSFN